MLWGEMATQQVTCRKSHRNRQIKYAQYAAAPVFCEKIRDKSWGDGDEGRFADPDQRVPNQQLRVGVRECSKEGEATPKNCAHRDDELARVAIRQGPDKRCGHHIEDEECAGQITDLG